mgnify:CR=1 FL=1
MIPPCIVYIHNIIAIFLLTSDCYICYIYIIYGIYNEMRSFSPWRAGLFLRLTPRGEYGSRCGLGKCTPHFFFLRLWRKKKRAVHGPKKKETPGTNLTAGVKLCQKYGGCSQTVPGNLEASIRVRLNPFLDGALCRSWDCLRGCFASLTQGPKPRFPRSAPGWFRSGRFQRLPWWFQ